jgi:hypothetical protein
MFEKLKKKKDKGKKKVRSISENQRKRRKQMSFFKTIAKEIQTVKSKLHVPDLRNQRYTLQKQLEESRNSLCEVRLVHDHGSRIRQVMRDLVDVSEICFEGQQDKKDSAQKVIHHLANRVEEADNLMHSLELKISKLEQELQMVNEKLSATL